MLRRGLLRQWSASHMSVYKQIRTQYISGKIKAKASGSHKTHASRNEVAVHYAAFSGHNTR